MLLGGCLGYCEINTQKNRRGYAPMNISSPEKSLLGFELVLNQNLTSVGDIDSHWQSLYAFMFAADFYTQ